MPAQPATIVTAMQRLIRFFMRFCLFIPALKLITPSPFQFSHHRAPLRGESLQ
jgi:hypothetical protein